MISHTQKNTLLQAATNNAETKACKRGFFSPTQEKIFLPFFFNPDFSVEKSRFAAT